jgi:hypothetical protein
MRIQEDLQRIAATERQPLDPRMACEIKELKEELSNHGYVYFDGYDKPFRLWPAVAPHKHNVKS